MKKYPFSMLNVGEAFDVPLPFVSVQSLRNLAQHHGKRLGKKFRVRTIAGEGVVEVSCTAADEDAADVFAIKPARKYGYTSREEFQRRVDEAARKLDCPGCPEVTGVPIGAIKHT